MLTCLLLRTYRKTLTVYLMYMLNYQAWKMISLSGYFRVCRGMGWRSTRASKFKIDLLSQSIPFSSYHDDPDSTFENTVSSVPSHLKFRVNNSCVQWLIPEMLGSSRNRHIGLRNFSSGFPELRRMLISVSVRD